MANTPPRALRLGDEAWGRITAEAEARGITASDVVREAIDEHFEKASQ